LWQQNKKNVDGKDMEEQVAYAIEYKTSLIEKKCTVICMAG
jgi:hypothetical protein